MYNIGAAVEKTIAYTDQNEATTGGGGLELPDAGVTRLRLISYIELGVHRDGPTGQEKNKELVFLEFELSGPKHPATNAETGRTSPFTISITLPLSQNEKASFYKLFKRLNHTGAAKHFAQLLGDGQAGYTCEGFMGTVVRVTRGEGNDKKEYANLRDGDGFTIRPPFFVDPETGESKSVKVDPAVSPLRCFIWSAADKEMWDSLFIDGKWDDKKDAAGNVIKEGVSKNYFQNRIRAALNFKGSPIGDLLEAGGEVVGLPDAEKPVHNEEATGADVDPLAGV